MPNGIANRLELAMLAVMSSPALLLVHGYPFDHSLWDAVAALVDNDARVIAPDLPGFGGRPPAQGEPALETMADDLGKSLASAGIERAVVAGMSMGGYVALAFAERFPARLAGLGLISSQAAADSEEIRANRRGLIERVRQKGPSVAAEAVVGKMFAPQNSGRPELVRFPLTGAEEAGVEGICWALEAMARRPDRTAVLKSIHVPVLIAHGRADQLIPAERARDLAASVANVRYAELQNAGHATPLEAPAQLADALKDLLRRASAGFPSHGTNPA